MTATLTPGIYPGIPFDEYCRIPYVNHSSLKRMEKSPRAFKWSLDHRDDGPNDGQRLGTGLHTLILEPAALEALLVPPPINPKTGKAYGSDTAAWREYAASFPGKLILSDEELDVIRCMSESLWSNPQIREHLASANKQVEETMIWECPYSGMMCKARVDLRNVGVARLDIKTSRESIHPNTFRNTVVRFGYHTQAAFYAIGAAVLDLPERKHYIAAVESEEDHDSALCVVEEASMSLALDIVKQWLLKVKQCRASSVWPGVQTENKPITIGVPLWYAQKWQDGEVGDVAA